MAKKYINLSDDNLIAFLNSQIDEWQLLRSNYDTYDAAANDKILFSNVFWETSKILLNYRKASLSADLKAIADGKRPCFLCKDARPAQQRTIIWEGYDILCNPYPASDIHYTIVCRDHTPQLLGRRILDMARLARMIHDCCIFYNGPQCGASAPDHMHFQAVSINEAFNFMLNKNYMIESVKSGNSRIYIPRPNMSAYGHYIMEITDDSYILPMFNIILDTLPRHDADEPMMNVLAFQYDNAIRIVIIPRKRHRPLCYGTAPGQMLVSPASLEMMGKFITSRKDDYNRLDETSMQHIYDDVAYSTTEFLEFVKKLSY